MHEITLFPHEYLRKYIAWTYPDSIRKRTAGLRLQAGQVGLQLLVRANQLSHCDSRMASCGFSAQDERQIGIYAGFDRRIVENALGDALVEDADVFLRAPAIDIALCCITLDSFQTLRQRNLP